MCPRKRKNILMKKLLRIHQSSGMHWVGNGFPVRSVFDYNGLGRELSPFLLLDYAAPYEFPPSDEKRGVGGHPHKGFETVTIAYQGEVEHRDSSGGGGKIGAGDVQWMTAGKGIVHEEFHSQDFTRKGGPFQMVQLWVNLRAGKLAELPLPDGHTTTFLVLSGEVEVDGERDAGEGDLAIFARAGDGINVKAKTDAKLLVMGGEPFDEPVVGHGPFVMNRRAEIQQAFEEYQLARMGELA